jgi:hypothetical protein
MGLAAIIPWVGKAIATAFKAKNIGTTIAAANAGAQLLTNRAQKKSNLEMYNTQRQDALADWNRQNQYNSPEAQMARFKEAGLNPHLIYGQMTTAQPIKTPEAKAPNYVAPQANPDDFNILGRQYALETQRLQAENMKGQGELIKAQILKAQSETDWKNINTRYFGDSYVGRLESLRVGTDLKENQIGRIQQLNRLIPGQIDIQKEQVRNILQNTNLSISRQAELSQKIVNMITAEKLLGEKVKTQEFENYLGAKIRAMGIAGTTAAALIKLFK